MTRSAKVSAYPPDRAEEALRGRPGGLRTPYFLLPVSQLLGREVAVLVDGYQTPGQHTVVFNGSRLASSVYFYRLTAGGMALTKKLVLLK